MKYETVERRCPDAHWKQSSEIGFTYDVVFKKSDTPRYRPLCGEEALWCPAADQRDISLVKIAPIFKVQTNLTLCSPTPSVSSSDVWRSTHPLVAKCRLLPNCDLPAVMPCISVISAEHDNAGALSTRLHLRPAKGNQIQPTRRYFSTDLDSVYAVSTV